MMSGEVTMASMVAGASGRRPGCVSGCLSGCLSQVLLVMIAGVALLMALQALLAPYSYYYGGHFHIYPGWQGEGWIHAPDAGGDYFLRLSISPSTPGYRKSDIDGIAYLCTPKGERFSLNVGGDLPRSRPTNTVGVPLHLYMHSRSIFSQANDHRPSLDLHGSFADRMLLLEDRGSIPTAFRPDGTLYPLGDPHRPWKKERVTFTLYEITSWTMGSPTCPGRP